MYLPIISLDRSQNVRIGKGFPDTLGPNSQIGTYVFHALHANLNDAGTRRDLQRHSAIGSYTVVGAVSAKWVDLYASTNSIVSAGTGMTVSTAAFTVSSRLFTDQPALSVASTSSTIAVPASTVGDVIYLITVDQYGNLVPVAGGASVGAPVYEVDTVTVSSGSATGTLTWTYNGYNYTCAFTAAETAANLATAFAGASSTNGGPTMAQYGAVAGTNVVGTGGALGTAAVTLTFSGVLEGAVTNQAITTSTGTATYVATTPASGGATYPKFDGNSLPLAFVFIAEGSTSVVSGDITSIAYTS